MEFSRGSLPHIGRPEKRRASTPSREAESCPGGDHDSWGGWKGRVGCVGGPLRRRPERGPAHSTEQASGLPKEAATSAATIKVVNTLGGEFDLFSVGHLPAPNLTTLQHAPETETPSPIRPAVTI